MTERRPLWQPFSEPTTDNTLPEEGGRPRLLAVERAPFLEPASVPDELPQAPGGRRRLGFGGSAADTTPSPGPRRP
ncbi:hypothetical protein ACFC26_17470 [Kitasatospora purpeofusca]|uniref:hypothetical protein n=1 Tax=Kitasatospora purpeofusca TaxID=67352 RepID=UPI0035DA1C39